jgi:hypothetical protein
VTTQKTAFELNPDASESRPHGTAILRSVLKIALLLTFVAVAVLPSLAQTSIELQTYFKNIVLSQDQITAIRSGQAVAKTLQSRIPDEIFVFGAVFIKAAPESYLKFAKDNDRMRKLPEFLALGEFSNPPQLSDLKGLPFSNPASQILQI